LVGVLGGEKLGEEPGVSPVLGIDFALVNKRPEGFFELVEILFSHFLKFFFGRRLGFASLLSCLFVVFGVVIGGGLFVFGLSGCLLFLFLNGLSHAVDHIFIGPGLVNWITC
jgi:hypothetical protein